MVQSKSVFYILRLSLVNWPLPRDYFSTLGRVLVVVTDAETVGVAERLTKIEHMNQTKKNLAVEERWTLVEVQL